MAEVVEMVFQSVSGNCPVDFAYADKMTITPEEISYTYTPYEESRMHPKREWKHTGDSVFRQQYKILAAIMQKALMVKTDLCCTDIGFTEVRLIYSDRTEVRRTFWDPSVHLLLPLNLIADMIPKGAFVPVLFRTAGESEEE